MLANSRLEVRNAKGYKNFAALVGVDDSTRNTAGKVEFRVYGDGKLLASSGPLAFGDAAKPLNADTAGVKLIELVARGTETGGIPVVVTWGDASLR